MGENLVFFHCTDETKSWWLADFVCPGFVRTEQTKTNFKTSSMILVLSAVSLVALVAFFFIRKWYCFHDLCRARLILSPLQWYNYRKHWRRAEQDAHVILQDLIVYPIKSLCGIRFDEWPLSDTGLLVRVRHGMLCPMATSTDTEILTP